MTSTLRRRGRRLIAAPAAAPPLHRAGTSRGDERHAVTTATGAICGPAHIVHPSRAPLPVVWAMASESAGRSRPDEGAEGPGVARDLCPSSTARRAARHCDACSPATSSSCRWTAERVERALLRRPRVVGAGTRRARPTTAATRLLAEVGFGDDVRVARQVAIEFGDPVRMPSKTVAADALDGRRGAAGLFPALEADLEIAPSGHGGPSSR